MTRVNPPPHLKTPERFFNDPAMRPYFQQLEFIVFQLWQRTGGGDDAIVENGNTSTDNSQSAQIRGVISRLEERVNEVEQRDFDGLNSKVARLNRIVNTILEELLEQISNLKDKELESKMICLSERIIANLELLNIRVEEAFETGLTEEDL